MKLKETERTVARMEIRRQHGCDSYYLGCHQDISAGTEARVIHEFSLDDPASTAYVWFTQAKVRVVLKSQKVPSPLAAVRSE